MFKRTEGVSTTDITGKLLAIAKGTLTINKQPPMQKFLATSRRIQNFANKNMPKPTDKIVYIQGSWDLLHHGHLKRLQAAKAEGTFLYVGIWDDEMTRYYRGDAYPIVSL